MRLLSTENVAFVGDFPMGETGDLGDEMRPILAEAGEERGEADEEDEPIRGGVIDEDLGEILSPAILDRDLGGEVAATISTLCGDRSYADGIALAGEVKDLREGETDGFGDEAGLGD